MYDLDFPRYHGEPVATGTIRLQPEDFQVDELLGFEPSGEGEHLYLHVRKRGENTQWLSRQIAKFAGVKPADVSYAGLKDRHAVTTQWFSVWLPGQANPDWHSFNTGSYEVLGSARHARKLKRGAHGYNRFCIRITNLEQQGDLDQRLAAIRDKGVPNYFGEQRFGHEGGNLLMADEVIVGQRRVRDRQKRGMYYSAARSYLFNLIVAERIRQHCLDRYLEGDRLMINGTSNLDQEAKEADIQQRLDSQELHPTAPLCGRGRMLTTGNSAELETDILSKFESWRQGLEHIGMVNERRAVRFRPINFSWHYPLSDVLELSFDLPPGYYATAVLRELCDYQVAAGSVA